MSENMNHDLDMEQENVVELVDEDGNAVRFEHTYLRPPPLRELPFFSM